MFIILLMLGMFLVIVILLVFVVRANASREAVRKPYRQPLYLSLIHIYELFGKRSVFATDFLDEGFIGK